MPRSPRLRTVATSRWVLVSALAAAVFATSIETAHAQKLDLRSKSRIVSGRSQVSDTATFSSKRYSAGYTNTFRQGRDLAHQFAGRLDATASTKLSLDTRAAGGETDWEVKVNQKFRAFTFDLGAGSDGLFHTGVKFGERKGKGFGFSASWVADDRRSGANLQLWHYLETLDLVAALRHDRRGFGWSANTGNKLANVIRGVLRYETSSGTEGNGSSHQVVYGRSMRDGSDTYTGFDDIRFIPEEDVFGDDGVNIRSPLYPDDDPLAWLVEGYGARLGEVDLDRQSVLEAEMISYISESVWVGGDVMMKDGVTEAVDAQFGVTGADLKLAATIGYAPQTESFMGAVQLRWTPLKPTATK